MRVGVFYFSLTGKGKGIYNEVYDSNGIRLGYVRCEVMSVADTSEGLDAADLRYDETLMNSHPLDAKDWDE